jgi:hypothetical protein
MSMQGWEMHVDNRMWVPLTLSRCRLLNAAHAAGKATCSFIMAWTAGTETEVVVDFRERTLCIARIAQFLALRAVADSSPPVVAPDKEDGVLFLQFVGFALVCCARVFFWGCNQTLQHT